MDMLFSSPLFTGGGHARHRLKKTKPSRVWHDSAYFAPLLWYYHQACERRYAVLRVDEVVLNHRSRTSRSRTTTSVAARKSWPEKKRIARRRALPLHPKLLRLGLIAYERAIKAERHTALFPELYLNEAKRGGAQFYNVAWRYLVDWLGERMDIPRNRLGKGPDIHSIRSLGSSLVERDGRRQREHPR